jgi:hypothetical protein
MPTDFDWIFKRDPYWRERPKKEPLAIPRNQATDARATRAVRTRRPKSANGTGVTAS